MDITLLLHRELPVEPLVESAELRLATDDVTEEQAFEGDERWAPVLLCDAVAQDATRERSARARVSVSMDSPFSPLPACIRSKHRCACVRDLNVQITEGWQAAG
jgi:hypothetical protein